MVKTMVALCRLIFAAMSLQAQKAPDAASPLAACGDENTTFSVTRGAVGDSATAPTADTAKVYIIELYDLNDNGRINRPTLLDGLDGKWLGATQGFTYLSTLVVPGVHHLCSRWQSRMRERSKQISLNDFEAVAGKRYYFRAQINVEGGVGDAPGPAFIDLQQVSEDEGRFLVSKAAQSISKQHK